MKITYTTIIHHLREKLDISTNEYIVADTIHKMSNTKDYPYCKMGKEKIAKCAGVTRRAVIKIIKRLEEKGLIERNDREHLRATDLWAETIDYDSELSAQMCDKSSQTGMNEVLSKCEQSSHNNNTISIKDNNKNKDAVSVFDHWNLKGIMKHRSMDKKTEGSISSKLKDYSKEEIIKAIDNFDTVVKDKGQTYWWTHDNWTLQQFLQRGFDKFKEESEPLQRMKKTISKDAEKEQEKEDADADMFLTEEEKEERKKKFMKEYEEKKKKEKEKCNSKQ
jgi:hypothetical protein